MFARPRRGHARARASPRATSWSRRYEERSGRSMSALHWYQALALWKAAVFMEGNYKRFLAGTSDDELPGGCSTRACRCSPRRRREIAHVG